MKRIFMGAALMVSSSAWALDYTVEHGRLNARTTYAIDSSRNKDENFGSPTSRLDYKTSQIDVTYHTLGFEKFGNRYELQGVFSDDVYGSIVDYDWYSKEYADSQGKPTLWAKTSSEVKNSSVAKIKLTEFIPVKVVETRKRSVEIAHYNYNAYGVENLTDAWGRPLGTVYGDNVLALSYRPTYLHFGQGSDYILYQEGKHRLDVGYEFRESLMYAQDYHYLRSDLQLPSQHFYMLGLGVDGRVKYSYKVNNEVSLVANIEGAYTFSIGVDQFKFTAKSDGYSAAWVNQSDFSARVGVVVKF